MCAAAPTPHTLKILVGKVSNAKGVVGVLVFNSAQGWPEDNARAFRATDVPAHPGQLQIVLPNLPDGIYAVVVLHDENENRKLDRNWYGAPKEQWGMSNNPSVHMSAPSFDQARFTLNQDKTIDVELR
jgi:uncharacterized protein (DUF2141 family)